MPYKLYIVWDTLNVKETRKTFRRSGQNKKKVSFSVCHSSIFPGLIMNIFLFFTLIMSFIIHIHSETVRSFWLKGTPASPGQVQVVWCSLLPPSSSSSLIYNSEINGRIAYWTFHWNIKNSWTRKIKRKKTHKLTCFDLCYS